MRHDVNLIRDPTRTAGELLWVTDLHLDSVDEENYLLFLDSLAGSSAEKLLIGGDISNGEKSLEYLKDIRKKSGKEIYFVLGNHDYYNHSISHIRSLAASLAASKEGLHYLTQGEVAALNDRTALIGHDGWSDGRAGDFLSSEVALNDYFYVEDLKNLEKKELLKKLNALGDEAAQQVEETFRKVTGSFEQIIFLTHAPPFPEACRYHDRECDSNWGPHFVCMAIGEVLRSAALRNPRMQVLVLCGHAHSYADVCILPNLRVLTGNIEIGHPCIQGVIRYTSPQK